MLVTAATGPWEGQLQTLQQLILACPCACRQALLQYLLVPLLQLAPLSYQVHTLQQRAAALISTIKGKPEGMSPSVAAEEGSALIAKAAAYRVLHVMYDSVPKEAIKEILKDVGGNKVAGFAWLTACLTKASSIYMLKDLMVRREACHVKQLLHT